MRHDSLMGRLTLIVLVTLLALSLATSAIAEPVTTVAEMRVAAQMVENTPLLFVMAVLDDSVALPAQVPIAIPSDATVVWVGELSGGEIDDDAETTYTLSETKDGWDIYLVDATTQRTVQVEATLAQSFLIATGEMTGTAALSYVPATDVTVLSVAAESPPNLVNFDQNTGYEVFGGGLGGGMIIGPSFTQAKAGETYEVSYSFQLGTQTENQTTTEGADSFGAVMIVLVLALVGLVAALFFIINRQRGGGMLPESADSDYEGRKKGSGDESHAYRPQASKQKPGVKGIRWNSPQTIIILLIAIAAIFGLIWASQRSATNITENDGVYSQVFTTGDPCRTLEFELTEQAMQDPKDSARQLFDVMRSADIILLGASLDSNTGILYVQFCESSVEDEMVAALIEKTGLVMGSSLKTLNAPVVLDTTTLVWYFSHEPPCATNSFTIVEPQSDAIAFLRTLAEAVHGVPSITAVALDSSANVATFGFCEDQADDDTIAAALKAAGIEATLKSGAAAPTEESVLAR